MKKRNKKNTRAKKQKNQPVNPFRKTKINVKDTTLRDLTSNLASQISSNKDGEIEKNFQFFPRIKRRPQKFDSEILIYEGSQKELSEEEKENKDN